MIYAAAAVWLTVVVLLAWGVRSLWARLASLRAINTLFLPGTLVGQVGYVLALLLTGLQASNVSLLGDEEPAESDETAPETPEKPLLACIAAGLLPMATVGTAAYFLTRWHGGPLLEWVSHERLAIDPPADWAAFWEQLRQLITLTEDTFDGLRSLNWSSWQSAAFVYLLAGLAIRMAPMPGNGRGHFGAILVGMSVVALAGTVWPELPFHVAALWPVLALMCGLLLLLMLASLLVRGLVEVFQTLRA